MNETIELLKKINSGKKLSQDENEKLISFIGMLENPDTIPEEKQSEFLSASEVASEMQESLSDYFQSPEAVKAREAANKRVKAGKVTNAVSQGLQLGLGLLDLNTSNKQIKQSDRGLRNLNRPPIPIPPNANPNLQNALNQSERDISNAGNILAPSELQILDQYFKDIGNAKTASTGQASNFGSLAQLASSRRTRSGQQLAPILEGARSNAISRRNNLLGMQQSQIQNNFNNQIQTANIRENRYNADAQALGSLGQTGRQNRQTAFSNIANQLPAVAGNISNLFANTNLNSIFGKNQVTSEDATGFGADFDEYAKKINEGLYSRYSHGTPA